MMTRKDYKLIAEAVRNAKLQPNDARRVGRTLADNLENDNPRFDRARFLEAIGVDDLPVTEEYC